MCTIECPDRGKCYLEHQAQCCAVFRANTPDAIRRFKNKDYKNFADARRMDAESPIPGIAESKAAFKDKSVPMFMRKAKARHLKEVYQ